MLKRNPCIVEPARVGGKDAQRPDEYLEWLKHFDSECEILALGRSDRNQAIEAKRENRSSNTEMGERNENSLWIESVEMAGEM